MDDGAKLRECESKTPYSTWSAAQKAADAARRRGTVDKDPGINPYWCRFCPFAHIGHSNKNKKRKR